MTKQRKFGGRRTFLASSAVLGSVGLAGCTGLIGGNDDEDGDDDFFGQIGSGRGFPEPGGTPMDDLPELAGELVLYNARGQALVGELLSHLESRYDDFTVQENPGGSADLVNLILEEGSATPADVFFTVNSGALGTLADEGRTQSLSSDVTEMVANETFATDEWVGTSGRARTIPYNTDAYDESEIPDSIDAFAGDFDGQLGWAPSYGSFQGFVTSMRIIEGDEATKAWLEGVLESGVQEYSYESEVTRAVASGEIDAGFANHYYIQRHLAGNPDAPVSTAFTDGDAGATFDVAGATVIDQSSNPELAENFIRHLLSGEAQAYFAGRTYEYPVIEGVDPIGELPSADELNTPDVDPTQLSDVEGTIELMRDAGVPV
ncbi:iron ABC transporter substrate-binding protein [Halovivax asiaticus JCM 14624]|uniref:Iron ABC transporter substrate-binding protein n=1 Tax=Halovivax asiaticus JCM 14624 TaxID=1227490 RepID=M0BI84_9EURY|nr:extracellular solute-binding protein [Halovivax asiaticus]ELZ09364.1 iron ABC transporter substrate-binding protein [Halovivax asiaticus JCM 14624]